MGNAAGLETHHLQLWHSAQHRRQFGKRVVRCKQNAQPRKSRQIIGKGGELVARQIENLQRLGQCVQCFGKLGQVVTDADMVCPCQGAICQAGVKLFKRQHRSRSLSLMREMQGMNV